MKISMLDPRVEATSREDLITPMHHHDGGDFLLAADPAEPGGHRRVSRAEAGRVVAAANTTPGVDQVDHLDGTRFGRRSFLAGGVAGFGAMSLSVAAPRMAFAATPSNADLLVVVFLDGAIDWLSGLVPVADAEYYKARRTIAVPTSDTVPLNPRYGLSKHMSALKPLWDAKQAAFVLGTGNPSVTRSHFEARITCEQAAPSQQRSGWIGRELAARSAAGGTFRALSMGTSVTTSLTTTAFDAVAMSAVDEFDLSGWGESRDRVRRGMDRLFARAGGELQAQAQKTLKAIDELGPVRAAGYTPASGAVYPAGAFGSGLKDVARMAKSSAMLEAAAVTFDGWDMHSGLGASSDANAWFSRNARTLSQALAAFAADLGPVWARTTVVVMSEFGRRVAENASGGLDHGHGNAMLVLGGGVNGGIYGSMPSLAPGNLVAGDVPITTDYRRVLSELIAKRMGGAARLGTVFPGYAQQPFLGLARVR